MGYHYFHCSGLVCPLLLREIVSEDQVFDESCDRKIRIWIKMGEMGLVVKVGVLGLGSDRGGQREAETDAGAKRRAV